MRRPQHHRPLSRMRASPRRRFGIRCRLRRDERFGARLASGYFGDRTGRYGRSPCRLCAEPVSPSRSWRWPARGRSGRADRRGARRPGSARRARCDAVACRQRRRARLGVRPARGARPDRRGDRAARRQRRCFYRQRLSSRVRWLVIPALLSMAVLLAARFLFPRPRETSSWPRRRSNERAWRRSSGLHRSRLRSSPRATPIFR